MLGPECHGQGNPQCEKTPAFLLGPDGARFREWCAPQTCDESMVTSITYNCINNFITCHTCDQYLAMQLVCNGEKAKDSPRMEIHTFGGIWGMTSRHKTLSHRSVHILHTPCRPPAGYRGRDTPRIKKAPVIPPGLFNFKVDANQSSVFASGAASSPVS